MTSGHPPRPAGELAARIGHVFADPAILERAMAHRSWCAEHPGHLSNERLEFLGDAVLGWLVADLAFHRFPDLSEGALTGVRKGVVNASALAGAAREIELGAYLLLGKGEDAAGGRDKVSILSDAFEAVIGALYVDGGPEVTRGFVTSALAPAMDQLIGRLDHLDHKSRLQELAARSGLGTPGYRSDSSGPDHEKWFAARVLIDGEVWGDGRGRSKKVAEQAAALAAVTEIERRRDVG